VLTYLDLRGTELGTAELRRTLPRGEVDVAAAIGAVAPVVEDVAARGTAAALDAGQRFDGVRPSTVRVPSAVMREALESLDPEVAEALRTAIERLRAGHSAQHPAGKVAEIAPGGTVSERWIPIERVGLYVPGGRAVYPSSVLMNVVPAQEAGVGSLVVASPPQAEFGGWPHPTILAACVLLGVEEVWAVGGAQAVALMAYGSDASDGEGEGGTGETLEPVDMITGPGNVFVTAAKRLVRSEVGIDSEAGPTEIAVLADDSADPVHVAYDLISQAEHDPMAASVLVTDSEEFAAAVDAEVAARYTHTVNAERVAEALEGRQSGIVLVDDLEEGLRVVDAYAAEHLEVQTRDARAVAARVRNAGAIFVGAYSPVPLGDYAAGSNHVLPTSGSARHSSGLSVYTFLRNVYTIDYDEAALKEIAPTIVALADAEQLPAHGEAIRSRFEDLTAEEQ